MMTITIDSQVVGNHNFQLTIPNLSLSSGYLYSVIGLNGSGKSTFLNTVADTSKQGVGYVPSNPDILSGFNKKQLIKLYKRGNDRFDFPFFETLLEQFKLLGFTSVSELSKGELKLLLFSLALASHPKLLLLDEVFNGLDVVNKSEVIELIQTFLEDDNNTCIMASNSIDDIVDISDYYIVVGHQGVNEPLSEIDIINQYTVTRRPRDKFDDQSSTVLAYELVGDQVDVLTIRKISEKPSDLNSVLTLLGGA